MVCFGKIMTLGELQDSLEAVYQNALVMIDNNTYPGDLISYRGYYEDIAIEGTNSEAKVSDLLEKVNAAIGGTFIGYKGGEFEMTRQTPVWVSDYGHASGIGLIGVEYIEGLGTVMLITVQAED